MWRVIVRFSIEKDATSALRNDIAGFLDHPDLLPNGKLKRTGTGTWESLEMEPGAASTLLAYMLDKLSHPQKVKGTTADTMLDHLWIYIDRSAA
jgi:hypothetical protein